MNPIETGYVKNGKTESPTTLCRIRVLEPGRGKIKSAGHSEKFIIDSEMGPSDIIRVDEDRDGLPRVLSHQLLQFFGQAVIGLAGVPAIGLWGGDAGGAPPPLQLQGQSVGSLDVLDGGAQVLRRV